jgi:glycosyltransferase involved in cell wall biosynthesis
VRILLVSQMYPGPAAPEFGVFVQGVARELEREHELAYAVIDRPGGSRGKYLSLLGETFRQARSFRPDVVYAHFLFPAGGIGAAAARAARSGLVVTAHGRDVRNLSEIAGVGVVTRLSVRRARVIAVSGYLRGKLVERLPELEGRVDVIDCGVNLERFRGRDASALRRQLGWVGEPPFFLFVGTLDERKNVVRLAEAFERLGRGSLAFVGDGPLRPALEGRPRVRLVGRVPPEEVADWIAACDILCQPSLVEPFGQALLEGLASERPVVATQEGGPPEFVRPEVGVLVDPGSTSAIEAGLREAEKLPSPNSAARGVAAEHDVRVQAARIATVLAEAAAQ